MIDWRSIDTVPTDWEHPVLVYFPKRRVHKILICKVRPDRDRLRFTIVPDLFKTADTAATHWAPINPPEPSP